VDDGWFSFELGIFLRKVAMSSDQQIQDELERLRAENEFLRRTSSKGLSLRISEKGGISVYGLGRFPVTLYKEQWLRLLDMGEDIRGFIKNNESQLKSKAQAQAQSSAST
jgi:hypothetical protein